MRPGSPLRLQPASAKRDDARGPDNTLAPPNGRPPASAAGAGTRGGRWDNQPASIPKTASRRAFPRCRGRPGRPRPGRPAATPLRPIPATVRHARRRSGERHERSSPRPPALPAPLADPPIALQPTHTRLRRARSCRRSTPRRPDARPPPSGSIVRGPAWDRAGRRGRGQGLVVELPWPSERRLAPRKPNGERPASCGSGPSLMDHHSSIQNGLRAPAASRMYPTWVRPIRDRRCPTARAA